MNVCWFRKDVFVFRIELPAGRVADPDGYDPDQTLEKYRIWIRPARNIGSRSDHQKENPAPSLFEFRIRSPCPLSNTTQIFNQQKWTGWIFYFLIFYYYFFVVVVIFSQYIVISYNFDNSHHVIKNLHCCC